MSRTVSIVEALHRWLAPTAGPNADLANDAGDAGDATDAGDAAIARELRLRQAHAGYLEAVAAADDTVPVSLADFLG